MSKVLGEKELREHRIPIMNRSYSDSLLIALFFFIAITVSIFNPLEAMPITDEISMVFSFVSFLFGILSGFFISALWSRFAKMRKLMSKEVAALEDLYEFVELGNKDVARELADKLDVYMRKALDFDIHEYQSKVNEEYSDLYKVIGELEHEGVSSTVFNRCLNVLAQFTTCRKEMIARSKDKIGKFHWAAVIMLAFLTVFLWMMIQFEGIFGIVVGTVLVFSVLTVLIILYDLNNLTWGEERIDIEGFEKVYDVIGKPRYYPEEVLGEVDIPEEIDEYRVGILKDPKTYEREVKTVKNK